MMKIPDSSEDLLFDAVAAFEAVVEADEVAVGVLAFDGAHRGGDPVFLAFGDAVAFGFDSAVLGGLEEPVAVAVPRAWRGGRFIGRRAFGGRPLALVLPPHPAGFCHFPL